MWDDYVPPSVKPVGLVPLFPVVSFTPHSACPHHGPIRDNSRFVCMACSAASKLRDRIIERLPAIPIEEPEDRLHRLEKLKADEMLTEREVELLGEIAEQIELLIDSERHPTKYRPTPGLKGGTGR